MIPPLLLDVEPHHFVSWRGEARRSDREADNANSQCLDMCAAPGSKVG
jgi:16S rRNA C967 or C1407 C5-methylase (RsmB/RsmF family)